MGIYHSLPSKIQSKMSVLSIILSSMVVAMVNSQTVEKAASPYTNIGCQCSSLTFVDSSGHIQGNCKSVDNSGAQWCYVDSHHSSCQDLVYSKRFPDNPWSYEACATPAVYQPTHAAHHQPDYAAHHQPAHVAHHQPAYVAHHQPAYVAQHQPVYTGPQHIQVPSSQSTLSSLVTRTLLVTTRVLGIISILISHQEHSSPSLLFNNPLNNFIFIDFK